MTRYCQRVAHLRRSQVRHCGTQPRGPAGHKRISSAIWLNKRLVKWVQDHKQEQARAAAAAAAAEEQAAAAAWPGSQLVSRISDVLHPFSPWTSAPAPAAAADEEMADAAAGAQGGEERLQRPVSGASAAVVSTPSALYLAAASASGVAGVAWRKTLRLCRSGMMRVRQNR